jgi:AcrR family transcriptional regulator
MAESAEFPASDAPLPAYAGQDDVTLMRNRILSAAAHLFSQRGFRGTTTRAISEVVGILSGSLFHYFGSKDQMLFEIMHEAAHSMCVRAETVVTAAAEPRAQFRGLLRLQLDCMLGEKSRNFYAVLISEWRELAPQYKPGLTVLRKRYFQAWHSVLEACEQQGMLRAEARTAQLVLHGAINWTNTWFRHDGRLSLEQYAEVLERLTLEPAETVPAHIAHRRGSSAVGARRRTESGR